MDSRVVEFIAEQKLDYHLGSVVALVCGAEGEGALDKLLEASEHLEHYIATYQMSSLIKKVGVLCTRTVDAGLCGRCPISSYAREAGCATCRQYIEQNPLASLAMLEG